ncbi:MAG: hypothetical protein AB1925_24095 [Actinomycetota bacterium]
MPDHIITPTDAAVRRRVDALSVHIPCGGIRGPVRRGEQPLWQSCRCEDHPVRWDGVDVSREYDLCIVCFRATAGGSSRWAWLACQDCRSVNAGVAEVWGFAPLRLGRHSLMHGVGVRADAPRHIRGEEAARLTEFARGDVRLRDWRRTEYPRLAARFDPLADVPLAVWTQEHPASRAASQDAFARLLGPVRPL